MSTADLMSGRFDDDESEDDNFNPAPADMSDEEDAPRNGKANRNGGARNEEDDDEDEEAPSSKSKQRRSAPDDEDGAGEDEEDAEGDGEDLGGDEDDEEDEEEDEEEEEVTGHRRKRRRERRNQFLDVEAEVDESEDEADEDEDELNELKDNFIADTHPDDLHELPVGADSDDRRHRELDRRREMEASLDAEKQAEILRKRYAKRQTGPGLGDSAIVPKRLLLPSVEDPSIWAVRCKEGKEREAVFQLMKRVEEKAGTPDQLKITAAFERGGTNASMRGYIYVEAKRQPDVLSAVDGIMNVYPRTKMLLVEIKEMPDLLRVQYTEALEVGSYVRIRRPAKYAGDLAQVIDVTSNGLEVNVRYVPRLDYGLNEDLNAPVDASGKRKRVAAGPRPPPRLFSDTEAKKRHARFLNNIQPNVWLYHGDEYANGYCVKDMKIQNLITKDVNPTLEEVTRFATGAEDGTENLDLNALAASLKQSTANASYLPGDIIEVWEGEQKGVIGKAVSVQADIVTMSVTDGPLRNQTIEVPVKGLRKRFRTGDHVKVIGGSSYRDEVGMVVKISEDKVTFVSDQNMTEITVFSKDLREASDAGGAGSLGQYALWDLVQLDPETVGCIVKIDRESMIVLDQNESTRTVLPSQISNKIEKRKHAVATDRNGATIHVDDIIKEIGGDARQGRIMHIHRVFLFMHAPERTENAGVFVARTANVASVSNKAGVKQTLAGPDLTAMNPALKRNGAAEANAMPPPKTFGRDRAIGQTVTIKKGGYKGLLGIVKDATDTHVRVELHTKSKTINVPKEFVNYRDKITGNIVDPHRGRGGYAGGGRGGGMTPRHDGSRTPMAAGHHERTPAWGSNRTPAGATASTGSRTPAWSRGGGDSLGSRTPAWQNDGSRTAYGAGSRTPAWAAGSKTPAYGGSSSRSDDPFSSGSKTPAYGMSSRADDPFSSGSKTPAYGMGSSGGGDAWGSKTPAYGSGSNATPAHNSSRNESASDAWGNTASASGPYDAPTPGVTLSAPTPGGPSGPTPSAGPYSAPTPAAYPTAPTPGAGWGGAAGPESAPTPGAFQAPTPGAGYGGPESAPTPAAAPTPGASGGGYPYAAPTPGWGAGAGVPETPGAGWGGDDSGDGPRYEDD